MNLFDCQLLSNPSANHRYPESHQNFEYIDHVEISNHRTDSVNDSSASAPEVSSSPYPTSSTQNQKLPEKNIQRAIYKGPDVFGKVLGPTADESILVGLQALMDMAGTLEFSGFTPSPSTHDTPANSFSRESREVTEKFNVAHQQDNAAFNPHEPPPDKFQHEIINEVKKTPCQYIITQENITAAVSQRKSKCQHSQTRVLPSSMICYNPDRTDYLDKSNLNLPCPRLVAPKPPMKCGFQPFKPSRQLPPEESLNTSPNCPCSQFYHQTTTISVMENSPADDPSCLSSINKRSPCKLVEQPTLIFPVTENVTVDAASTAVQEKKSVASEPTKETISTPIQTSPLPNPKVRNAKVETESVASLEKFSVACDCNFSMPISADVSKPSSRMSNVCKILSSIRFSDTSRNGCSCSACCRSKENLKELDKEKIELPVVKNKSCTCSLIAKGVRLADAAISCLKVNTSCQYYRSEITPIESRSTQCGKLNHRRESCSQMCSESGDCQPNRQKSVRIIGGPYECPDFSETRYCMEPKSSRCVIPLSDCNDDISKLCFEKPTRVCLEMGDSFVPPPMDVRYAITKITKFQDFSTFEVMKSTSKKPKCMPKTVEGVFVLKKEENSCSSKIFE